MAIVSTILIDEFHQSIPIIIARDMPTGGAYSLMFWLYMFGTRSGVARNVKFHCCCPIVKSAIGFAVFWFIEIAFAIYCVVIQIAFEPSLFTDYNRLVSFSLINFRLAVTNFKFN